MISFHGRPVGISENFLAVQFLVVLLDCAVFFFPFRHAIFDSAKRRSERFTTFVNGPESSVFIKSSTMTFQVNETFLYQLLGETVGDTSLEQPVREHLAHCRSEGKAALFDMTFLVQVCGVVLKRLCPPSRVDT
jgi:hypothetical protein